MKNAGPHPNDAQTDRSCLYVFSPTPQDRTYRIQMDLLDARRSVLLGHDVVVAEIFEDQQGQIGSENLPPEGCDGLRRRFRVPNGRFCVMLVGKDSHIKLIADSCVSFEEVIMRVENEPQHQELTTD